MKTLLILIAAAMLHGCAVMKPDMTDFTGVTLPDGLQAPGYTPVQVGHELMHCMWSPRTMAGMSADGIPAHFLIQK